MMNICDMKEIPYIYSFVDSGSKTTALNLHPPPEEIAQALHDLIHAFEWARFVFLYESGTSKIYS